MTDGERWALYAPWLEHKDGAIRANAVICLIHQANYLLDKQIAALEEQFVTDGGYSEKLAAARLAERDRRRRRRHPKDRSNQSDPSGPESRIPECPQCGSTMVLRTARACKSAGNQFWGCAAYPDCRGAVNV